jgi:hypothetical protein
MRILVGESMTNWGTRIAVVAFGLAMVAMCSLGQAPQGQGSSAKAGAVEFLYPEQVTVEAGKPAVVKLHFRVADGMHINSHAPKEEFLIPTTLEFPEGVGVKLERADYPTGGEYSFAIDPGSKLSVYVGPFEIEAHIRAEKGNHLVEAKLHYQACNNAQCLPPRTAAVAVDVIGK